MAQISRLKDAEISNGNLINADDLDAEFNQLVNESNSQDTRLGNLESNNMTIAGVKTFTSAPKADQVNERTSDNGVDVDGVLCKDGYVNVLVAGDPATPAEGNVWYDDTANTLKYRDNAASRALLSTASYWPKNFLGGRAPTYTSASSITLPAGLRVRDSGNVADMEVASDITLSLATSGAGGLDTGSEANNTWYYVYLIRKSSDGTVSAVFSATNEAVTGSITFPTGYDQKRQLPIAVRNDGSGNIIPFFVANGWPDRPLIQYNVTYTHYTASVQNGTTQVLAGGTSTSFATISCGSFIPPLSKIGLFKDLAIGSRVTVYRKNGDSVEGISTGVVTGGVQLSNPFFQETDSSQQIQYKHANNNSATYVDVVGYVVTEV